MFSSKMVNVIQKLDQETIQKIDQEIRKTKIKKKWNLFVLSPTLGKARPIKNENE